MTRVRLEYDEHEWRMQGASLESGFSWCPTRHRTWRGATGSPPPQILKPDQGSLGHPMIVSCRNVVSRQMRTHPSVSGLCTTGPASLLVTNIHICFVSQKSFQQRLVLCLEQRKQTDGRRSRASQSNTNAKQTFHGAEACLHC